MDRYVGPVTHLAFRFLGTQADAEEIAQETFLRLYQRPPQLSQDVKLFTWLYRVTVNLSIDRLRKQKREGKTVSWDLPQSELGEGQIQLSEKISDPRTLSAHEQLAQSELAVLTHRAVEALPESLRIPLLLSIEKTLSHQEIAQILEISSKAVERRIAKARTLLKQRLAPFL